MLVNPYEVWHTLGINSNLETEGFIIIWVHQWTYTNFIRIKLLLYFYINERKFQVFNIHIFSHLPYLLHCLM